MFKEGTAGQLQEKVDALRRENESLKAERDELLDARERLQDRVQELEGVYKSDIKNWNEVLANHQIEADRYRDALEEADNCLVASAIADPYEIIQNTRDIITEALKGESDNG
jgi:predicted RNase H-like nuclease (RuvC/YqgF family)